MAKAKVQPVPKDGPSEIDGVPTVAGLARKSRDLAYLRPDGKYHVTDAGHAAMNAAMKANAQAAILRGDTEWRQPPSSGKERTDGH